MCLVDIVNEVLLGEDVLLCDSSGSVNIIQFEASIPLKMVG